MSIIQALRTYLATYPALEAGAPLFVDNLGPGPTQYAIVPQPGEMFIEKYVDGGSQRQFLFTIESMESTADDLERLENSGFYEALSDWFETQTAAGTLPTLTGKKTATAIEALSWAFIYEQGQSDTGIYQMQCRLIYDQQP